MAYFNRYILLSTSNDIETTLIESHNHLIQVIHPLTEKQMDFTYDKGKWNIREILQHLIDTERIFVYRALRFARNDKTDLPGYDHESYNTASNAKQKSQDQLLKEFVAVHRATVMFFNQLPEEAFERKGQASGEEMTVNQIAHIIAGHTQHHISVLEERYLSIMLR
jgi:hypothetical protein